MSEISEHHFVLVLSGVSENTTNLEDDIFEAGCDDALVFYKNNTVYLEFDRAAGSLEGAIVSAIRVVEDISMDIQVKRVEPDIIVNLSDIGRRTNLSRQHISMLVSGERGDGTFPSPILKVTSSNPLWSWSAVADWMYHHKKLDKESVNYAHFLEDINGALDLRNQETVLKRQQLLYKIEQKLVA